MIFFDSNGPGRDETLDEATRRILSAAMFYESTKSVLDVLFCNYCAEKIAPFSVVFLEAESENIEELLKEEKRFSDILIRIDACYNRYVLVCLDTKVQGGFFFAQRLMRRLKTVFAKSIYMVVTDIRSCEFKPAQIACALTDAMAKAKTEKREGEVVVYTYENHFTPNAV